MRSLSPARAHIEAAWRAFVVDGRTPRGVRPEIQRSWDRARLKWNVDPRLRVSPTAGHQERTIGSDAMVHVASGLLDRFADGLKSGGHVAAFFDAEGVMLRLAGNERTRSRLADVNFAPGACWAERFVGTNGPGTALVEGRPVEVFAAEHFVEAWQPWTCASAPVRFHGHLVGAVDITSPWTAREPSLLLTAEALALAIESALRASAAETQAALLLDVAEGALSSRDELLSVVSHEVKTPLTPLRCAIQKLQREVRERGEVDPVAVERTLRRADAQVGRLVRAIDYLSDSLRLLREPLQPDLEPVDLAAMVSAGAEALRTEALQAGCQLAVSSEPAVVATRCDRGLVERAIWNLVTNAIKYAPGRIELGVHRGGRFACVVVEDHGPGIAPHDQARVFEPYQRAVSSANHSGLGLGLPIVRRIAEAHGGTIAVETAAHGGSRFVMELPILET